nr:MAG TPA: VPR protein [Caudoviricetes sp.]
MLLTFRHFILKSYKKVSTSLCSNEIYGEAVRHFNRHWSLKR